MDGDAIVESQIEIKIPCRVWGWEMYLTRADTIMPNGDHVMLTGVRHFDILEEAQW